MIDISNVKEFLLFDRSVLNKNIIDKKYKETDCLMKFRVT